MVPTVRYAIVTSLLLLAACDASSRDRARSAADTGSAPAATPLSPASAEFAKFVDGYLDRFAVRHPSIAAGNGLHAHDDRLEDFSAAAVAEEIVQLERDRVWLAAADTSTLTPDERADRRILAGLVDAWLLDLGIVRTWTRNPMIYAAAIADGVHNLMTMESDAPELRLARTTAKLREVPALLASARANIEDPPRVFVERGMSMLRGVPGMLDDDIPRAFAAVADSGVWAEHRAAADTAERAITAYVAYLERRVLPRAHGDFAVGAVSLAARYEAEEMIAIPLDRMLAIGDRELARAQADFRAAAARRDPGRDAMAVWRDVQRDHPARGELVAAARAAVDELIAFGTERRLVELPPSERVTVEAAPPFDIGLASMHSSPPLEAKPVRSYYYITDAHADWPADRQAGWLEHFNRAALAIVTAHEVYPGHWVHALHMRRTPGKVRRIWIGLNPFPQPSSGQDGWAHYAEQLVVDEGFHADQPEYRMAQLSQALTRICRLIAGIKLHTRAWTVDQTADFFQQNAYLPAPTARAEAERGTYDPTYGVYFLGKLAALELRRDYAARLGARFDARAFHARVMTNGIAPWRIHRELMLPGDTSAIIE